jgi:hypothetical protein
MNHKNIRVILNSGKTYDIQCLGYTENKKNNKIFFHKENGSKDEKTFFYLSKISGIEESPKNENQFSVSTSLGNFAPKLTKIAS